MSSKNTKTFSLYDIIAKKKQNPQFSNFQSKPEDFRILRGFEQLSSSSTGVLNLGYMYPQG